MYKYSIEIVNSVNSIKIYKLYKKYCISNNINNV